MAAREEELRKLADKGADNLKRKLSGMRASYAASESRAKAGYDATPFGPTRKANYKSAWSVMPSHYNAKMVEGIESKWKTNWASKMAE